MIDAIILARGGSKGIPKKNLKLFCGKPLIAWTILQAKLSKKIDNVYVSSDSLEILNISKKYGAKIIKRPSSISGDKAKSESAILHALTVLGDKQKGIVMLEPTAPLRSPNDLDNCIKLFIDQNWDSGFSGAYLADFLIWKNTRGKLKSINYDSKKQGPRQMREPDIVENGAIYIFNYKKLTKSRNYYFKKTYAYLMPKEKSVDIDDIFDFKLAESLYKL